MKIFWILSIACWISASNAFVLQQQTTTKNDLSKLFVSLSSMPEGDQRKKQEDAMFYKAVVCAYDDSDECSLIEMDQLINGIVSLQSQCAVVDSNQISLVCQNQEETSDILALLQAKVHDKEETEASVWTPPG